MKRIRPFYLLAGAVVLAALVLLGCYGYLLGVRTDYKNLCVEINDAILSAPAENCTVEQGGQVWQADEALLDCYDAFLLLPQVWAVKREQAEPTEESIVLHLGADSLSLTELENGDVNLLWQTAAGRRGFTLNAGPAAFRQLEMYLKTRAKTEQQG